jgi:hypothetical protein
VIADRVLLVKKHVHSRWLIGKKKEIKDQPNEYEIRNEDAEKNGDPRLLQI